MTKQFLVTSKFRHALGFKFESHISGMILCDRSVVDNVSEACGHVPEWLSDFIENAEVGKHHWLNLLHGGRAGIIVRLKDHDEMKYSEYADTEAQP